MATAMRDAGFETVYDLEYLRGNIMGGEGYDWFYASQEDRELQLRSPISDGAHGEPWVFRYKDLRNWWENAHFERDRWRARHNANCLGAAVKTLLVHRNGLRRG